MLRQHVAAIERQSANRRRHERRERAEGEMPEREETEGASVDAVVERLREHFGRGAFDIVEQWDSDLCTIGIAQPQGRARLVYISTCGLPAGRYDVSIEDAPVPGSDLPPVSVGHFTKLDFDALARLVAEHLHLEPSGGAARER